MYMAFVHVLMCCRGHAAIGEPCHALSSTRSRRDYSAILTADSTPGLSGTLRVCSGDEFSAVNLTCRTTGSLAELIITPPVTMVPERGQVRKIFSGPQPKETLVIRTLANATTSAFFLPNPLHGLVYQLLISPVPNGLNGTVVTCNDLSAMPRINSSATVEIVSRENVRLIVQGKSAHVQVF